MIDYGKIIKVEIGNDKDADKKKCICTVEFSDGEDVRTVQVVNLSGFSSKPLPEQKVVVLDLGGGFEVVIASDDEIDFDLEDGETAIYSNDPDRTAVIKLQSSGQIIMNRGEDWAVRYSELETQFNELKDAHNALVDTFNSHIHTTTATVGLGPAVGVISAPTSPSTDQSAADITTTKVDSINVP